MTRVDQVQRVREAYQEQWATLRTFVSDLDFERPSALAGWTVGDLVAHLSLVADSIVTAMTTAATEPAVTISAYVGRYRAVAESIDARTRQAATGDVLGQLDSSALAAEALLVAVPSGADPVVGARRGAIRLSDFLITRCIELVVHADDLARSLERSEAPLRPRALQIAVRGLADVVAVRAPGHSVELRVPPYAAVQCVPGPRHTRGTPPAVVETDPVTFLRLACDRIAWEDAVVAGSVRQSGLRTDLSPYLPVLS